jgi:hypothetical protein
MLVVGIDITGCEELAAPDDPLGVAVGVEPGNGYAALEGGAFVAVDVALAGATRAAGVAATVSAGSGMSVPGSG